MSKIKPKPKFPFLAIVIAFIIAGAVTPFTFQLLNDYGFTPQEEKYVIMLLIVAYSFSIFLICFFIYKYFIKINKYKKGLQNILDEKIKITPVKFKHYDQTYHYSEILKPIIDFYDSTSLITCYENAISSCEDKIKAADILHKDNSEFIDEKNKYNKLIDEVKDKISNSKINDEFFLKIRESLSLTLSDFDMLFDKDDCLTFIYGFLKDTNYKLIKYTDENKHGIYYLFLFPLVIAVNMSTQEAKVHDYNCIKVIFNKSPKKEIILSVYDHVLFKRTIYSTELFNNISSKYNKAIKIIKSLLNNTYYNKFIKGAIPSNSLDESTEYEEMIEYVFNHSKSNDKREKNKTIDKEPKHEKIDSILTVNKTNISKTNTKKQKPLKKEDFRNEVNNFAIQNSLDINSFDLDKNNYNISKNNIVYEGNSPYVAVPYGVENIESFSTTNIKEEEIIAIYFPESLKEIGEYCFSKFRNLKFISYNFDLSRVHKGAFENTKIILLILPRDSYQTKFYYEQAFPNIRMVYIPKEINTIVYSTKALPMNNLTTLLYEISEKDFNNKFKNWMKSDCIKYFDIEDKIQYNNNSSESGYYVGDKLVFKD